MVTAFTDVYKRQSLGHVKDLPKSTLGVDTDDNFETDYVVIPGKEKVLARLKKLAGPMDAIYLAPDPDREGEAIAAHLAGELDTNGHSKKSKKKKSKKKDDTDAPPRIQRVTFNEITKRAVQAAFEHPRAIDQNPVSYTHLDVYKRQACKPSPRNRLPPENRRNLHERRWHAPLPLG